MAIVLSDTDYWMFQDEQSASDASDITYNYPSQLGQGFIRNINLREGLMLDIADYQLHNDIIIYSCDREHPLEYTFGLPDRSRSADAIPYHLFGSGTAPGEQEKQYANQRIRWVSVHIDPEVFRSFAGNPDGEIPEALRHLVGDPNQEYYVRLGQATPEMCITLRQILHCPYQGFMQRMFLEGKVWELMALLLEQEIEATSGKQFRTALKPDDVDRVHDAKDILLQRLTDPPSLAQLARQVGLNECTLKRGFRQVFGTTAFGYLHHYRLEQARQLLQERRLNVSEVAHAVGFGSCSHLSKAFRQQYGVSPKRYQGQFKNSI
jgi:AraC-like DNA-binding protein